VERLAQSPAAVQITQHTFGYHVDGLIVLRPLQLFLAAFQVLQRIFEPEQVDFTLAHQPTSRFFTPWL
jgi:hypothetical protein